MQYPSTAISAVIALLSASVQAQLAWQQLSPPISPPARNGHDMVYDSVRGKLVMFGGETNAAQLLGDTWEFDGATWMQVASSGPSPRRFHAMAFDSLRGVTVLFGGMGSSSTLLDDHWEFDGNTWTQALPLNVPPARQSHAMAYDAGRTRCLLVGGAGVGGISNQLLGTWEYDGADWTLVAACPQGALNPILVYDPQSLLSWFFGGGAWSWDGASWQTCQSVLGPSLTRQGALDTNRNRITALLTPSETWEFSGVEWSLALSAADTPYAPLCAMAFDEQLGRTVAFGGGWTGTAHNETWIYGDFTPPTSATATSYGTGCGSPPLAFTPGSTPVIGTMASATMSNMPTGLAGVAMGWSNTFAFPVVLPFDLGGVGMPGCDLLQSSDVLGLGLVTGLSGTAGFSYALPYAPSLAGGHVYLQGYCYAPGANAVEIVSSNGIDWLIGNR